jgi:hypothetical protein
MICNICLALCHIPELDLKQLIFYSVQCFLSGWPILSTLIFLVAILIVMFPSQLPSQAVKEMAASIVDLARGVRIQEPTDPKESNTGLWF